MSQAFGEFLRWWDGHLLSRTEDALQLLALQKNRAVGDEIIPSTIWTIVFPDIQDIRITYSKHFSEMKKSKCWVGILKFSGNPVSLQDGKDNANEELGL